MANTESQENLLENNDDPQKLAANQKSNDQVNMGLSGKLLEETNTVNGVVVKYSEPSEARKPKTRWRLYVFKGNEELPILYIHRQSAYLLGRDRKVIIVIRNLGRKMIFVEPWGNYHITKYNILII